MNTGSECKEKLGCIILLVLVAGLIALVVYSVTLPEKYKTFSQIPLDQIFVEGDAYRLIYTENEVVKELLIGKERSPSPKDTFDEIPADVRSRFRENPGKDWVLVIRDLNENEKPYALVVWFEDRYLIYAEIHLSPLFEFDGGVIDKGKFGYTYVREIE